MHELSIAEALLEQVRRHTPPGGRVRRIKLRVGPLRGIEPEAMLVGWRAATAGTDCDSAELCMEMLPWTLCCPQCQRQWTSDELYVSCDCGCCVPHPVGGNELDLMSMDVDVPDEQGN